MNKRDHYLKGETPVQFTQSILLVHRHLDAPIQKL